MSRTTTADDVLEQDFLLIRARLLEIAASLDRIDRAERSVARDVRIDRIVQAIEILKASGDDRAEQIQLVFSRPYDPDWKALFAAGRPVG